MILDGLEVDEVVATASTQVGPGSSVNPVMSKDCSEYVPQKGGIVSLIKVLYDYKLFFQKLPV